MHQSNRCIDDVINRHICSYIIYSKWVPCCTHLFSNRSRKMSKCGENISDSLEYCLCNTFLFLPHFDVICDLILNRYMATCMYDLLAHQTMESEIICQMLQRHFPKATLVVPQLMLSKKCPVKGESTKIKN